MGVSSFNNLDLWVLVHLSIVSVIVISANTHREKLYFKLYSDVLSHPRRDTTKILLDAAIPTVVAFRLQPLSSCILPVSSYGVNAMTSMC